MRKFLLAAGSAGGLLVAMTAGQTAPLRDESAIRLQSGLVENVDYVWRGKRYCFYDDGWHGPGWYWCGYRHRHGLGWGGERGWQGWERREWRSEGRHREERREGRRDRREDRKEIRTDRREDRKEMKTERREDRKEMKSEKSNMGKTEKTAPSGNKDEAKDKK
jgi:hypothetical protein